MTRMAIALIMALALGGTAVAQRRPPCPPATPSRLSAPAALRLDSGGPPVARYKLHGIDFRSVR